MTHELPKLNYPKSALEPYIDARTMAIHHDKHHAAYVANLNKALENYPDLQNKSTLELLSDLDSLPDAIRTAVRNNGGGHANHTMFWTNMSPNGGGEPSGSLANAIHEAFDSYANFQESFSQAAATLFGSGWAWLCMDNEGKLLITTTANQDNPISQGQVPLLGLDVWEHAYYLQYENRRTEYIEAWWNVVYWNSVAINYGATSLAMGARDVAKGISKWAEDTWSKIDDAFSSSEDD